MRSIPVVFFFAISLLATATAAIPRAPSLKPNAHFVSNVISKTDFQDLSAALDAADSGKWSTVRTLRKRISDTDARNLLLWELTTSSGANPTFSELNLALETLQDWPDTNRLRREAEALLHSSGLSFTDKKDWLKRYPPLTGEGKLEWAQILRQDGSPREADALIRQVWRNNSLSLGTTVRLLQQYEHLLTRVDHTERVDMLLWTGQRTDARRLRPRLSSADRKVVDARLALMERRRGVDTTINAVPSSLQDHPGLLYERAKWRRQRTGDREGAIELLLKIEAGNAHPAGRTRIWRERSIMLRTLIKEKRWDEAYAISADHHMTSGVSFAEAAFFAGWIALRKQGDAAKALAHFETLSQGVSTPISLSRGHYWHGEALLALKRDEEATTAFQQAVKHDFTFYGQLAAEKLSAMNKAPATLSYIALQPPTETETLAFNARPVVRAARLMAETGRLRQFEKFSFHIDDELTSPQDHQLLYDVAMSYLQPRSGVRGGKSGLAKGLLAPDAAFPIITLPNSPSSGAAEPALVLALSRQESELTPTAVSHANARGMMQLLPSTARSTARMVGQPYRTSWLTDDPEYNLTLGRGFLDSLVKRFNGSYIMALAAYNAGPSRPEQWVEDYGDPRTGEIDPIDWIESIPFSETRNYVQRILENTQVYRQRLAGQPTRIQLTRDLRRGELRR